MDKAKEIAKVQSVLKVPVTDLEFNETYKYVEVISDRLNIGGIPFYNVAGILSYDTSENVVNWLKWAELYNQNKSQIDIQIIELVGTDKIDFTCGTFRNLHVRFHENDSDSDIHVECFFDNVWRVIKK